MLHSKWETYLAISRKIETGGRNSDANSDNAIDAQHQGFVDRFKEHLAPPARVLAPGAMSEALLLAEAGYEVHSLVLGPDNVTWLKDRAVRLTGKGSVHVYEADAHDLDFPSGFFQGYFSVQFHEHLLAPLIHIGEVRYCLDAQGVVFVDAAGHHESMKMIWHTNLVPEQVVLEQWEYWGFEELWRGPNGDQRPQFILRARPFLDPAFKNAGYLQWAMRLRDGERIPYAFNCANCSSDQGGAKR